MELPSEIWIKEIGRYLLEIDKQLLRKVSKSLSNHFQYVKISIDTCDLEIIHIKTYFWMYKHKVVINLASRGRLDCIKYMASKGDQYTYPDAVFKGSAEGGQIDCLDYIWNNSHSFDKSITAIAIRNGHLHWLKHFHNITNHPSSRNDIETAITSGQIDCLRYLYLRGDLDVYAEKKYMIHAVCHNQLDCFKFLCQIFGVPTDIDIPLKAAEYDSLECLQYICENGGVYNDTIINKALLKGHFKCAKYLHTKDCHIDDETINMIVREGNIKDLTFLYEHEYYLADDLLETAAFYNQIEVIKYLLKIGCIWSAVVPAWAAHGGHIKCLVFLHENGCPWDRRTIEWATKANQKNCLNYALKNGCS